MTKVLPPGKLAPMLKIPFRLFHYKGINAVAWVELLRYATEFTLVTLEQ